MQTEIITITDVKAQQADLARAGKVLRGGGLVAFPTETVYGLGANGLDADACARKLRQCKQRVHQFFYSRNLVRLGDHIK